MPNNFENAAALTYREPKPGTVGAASRSCFVMVCADSVAEPAERGYALVEAA